MKEKSCFNCKLAHVTAGYMGSYLNPPEYPEAECNCKDVPDYIFDKDEPATECGWYEPVLIEKCAECGNEMNVPEYLWDIWAINFESDCTEAVCSHLCRARVQDKHDAYVRKQIKTFQQNEMIGE